jgi:hypothetical protein
MNLPKFSLCKNQLSWLADENRLSKSPERLAEIRAVGLNPSTAKPQSKVSIKARKS